ncbi:MAG: CapA family protein, partial [Eubacteriales bacterium]|nr:CapA family protein [Eubacteriales bacterium]
MTKKKKANRGVRLLLFILELAVAVAILFFVAKSLPKDLTLTSIGSGISQSLLITTPEPDPTQAPTAAPTATPAPTPVVLVTPEAQTETEQTALPETEVGIEGEEQTEVVVDTEPTDPAQSTTGEESTSEEEGDSLDTFDETQPTEPPVATPEPELVSTARSASITISAAGDCTLGGDALNGGLKRFERVFDEYGEDYFLENVKDIFAEDDLTIVNLEGALTGETARKDKEFSFKGDPRFAKILTSGSVEVVSIDNNHSQDYYSQGLADTKKTLDYVGVGYAGLGTTYTTTIEGTNIGMLSYRVWDMSVEEMSAEISALKQECDLVIVSIHWGEEKVGKANATQIKLGHAAVDAGADLVLGHHPHVVGSIELYKDKYIVYSLGNFCFGGNSNPADKDTFI